MIHFCVKGLDTHTQKGRLVYFYVLGAPRVARFIDYSGSIVLQHLLCKRSAYVTCCVATG